jgi:hypothetical protein
MASCADWQSAHFSFSFRLSVAEDKLTFPLGEQVHRLLQWK